MPLLIQPPRFSSAARDPGLVYTIIEPDPSEQIILQDLQTWGWRVTQHDFGDEEFIDALKLIEKDIKRRRRQTHAIAGELYGYNERPTLEDIWAKEAERMLGEDAYEAERRKVEMYVSAQASCNQVSICTGMFLTHLGPGFKRPIEPGR
jgi:hypothetical protein